MKNPLVSVIIPTYNRANFLKEAMESVLSQTYENWELIVVDDGSTDNTSELVEKFTDKRISYLYQQNRGAPVARNKGIQKAKGNYIAFLDSDDIWLPQKIRKQLEVFKISRFNPGVLYSGIKYIDENGKKIREEKLPAYRGNLFLYLLGERRNVVLGAISTVLIRRICFEECGLFDDKFPSRQDLDLLIRISRKFTFDYVSEPLVKKRIHIKRISSNIDALIKGRELLFEKIYNDLKQHRRILAKYYYHTGVLYFRKSDKDKGKEYIIKSIKAFPLICAIKELWKYR